MTTLYFESSQPNELRIQGFSKDGYKFMGLWVYSSSFEVVFEKQKSAKLNCFPLLMVFGVTLLSQETKSSSR